ncbi:hypothetical protein AZI86_01375 [Bdellovibrio bacteriovorus]|uniref:NlpC/P60 domain-containing protein n=1 Tax=Bdellovibrio bacteriovorus TaxID=959 RepID=A0A150WNH9_BDEBC|nr:hypothetical protein [Bdellovibrio bacteriovorus]KYG65755.1 hypothetical protein AZI86_01375 [Bdellovibrio bacteriovorus]
MIGTTPARKLVVLSCLLTLMACAPGANLPSIDESGSETATEVREPAGNEDSSFGSESPSLLETSKKLLLNQAMTLRYEKSGVLESKVELPEGTQIEIPQNFEVKYLDYRTSSGAIERSSTGFVYPIKVLSVQSKYQSSFPASKIASINATAGGLYISASIVGNIEGTTGNFAVIAAAAPGAGFATYYQTTGKPKVGFTTSAKKRFGDKLNKGTDPASLSSAQRQKYQSIYNELVKAVNRKVATPKSYLMMDKAKATQASINFEKTGTILTGGAWTIATEATAVRHGFPNVPCAEFQSELLRQAYQRAGYRVTDDFSKAKGNQLIWSNTAAVVNFSMALYKAGWTAWDPQSYRPIVGSFLMHGSGLSPGHTYISAGDDGMVIVDNGAPQGRDLRKSTAKSISIQFQTGVFFLPPGVIPPKW